MRSDIAHNLQCVWYDNSYSNGWERNPRANTTKSLSYRVTSQAFLAKNKQVITKYICYPLYKIVLKFHFLIYCKVINLCTCAF